MKLSVIIPFYCELELIGRAIESVINNTEDIDGLEILLCNDGHLSDSIIKRRISSAGLAVTRVVKNIGPKGPGGARNTGIEFSTGDIIAFLDADDYWLDGKLSAQIALIRNGSNFVVTAYSFEDGGAVIQPPKLIVGPMDIFLKRGIGTSTVLISRSLLGTHRFKDLRFAQDIDFWFSLAKSKTFKYVSIEHSYVVYSNGGSTKNKWEQFQYLNKVLQLNFVPPILRIRILNGYFMRGIFNHYIRRYF